MTEPNKNRSGFEGVARPRTVRIQRTLAIDFDLARTSADVSVTVAGSCQSLVECHLLEQLAVREARRGERARTAAGRTHGHKSTTSPRA